jgi:hypothetical protein
VVSAGASKATGLFGRSEGQGNGRHERNRSRVIKRSIAAVALAGSALVLVGEGSTVSDREDTQGTIAVAPSFDNVIQFDKSHGSTGNERHAAPKEDAPATQVELSVNGAKSTISENLLDKINTEGLKLPHADTQKVMDALSARLTAYNQLTGRDTELQVGTPIIIPNAAELARWIQDAERTLANAAH